MAGGSPAEPGGGSDVAAMKTIAVRKGDQWILDGSKTFVSNANKADIFTVYAKTDPALGRDGVWPSCGRRPGAAHPVRWSAPPIRPAATPGGFRGNV